MRCQKVLFSYFVPGAGELTEKCSQLVNEYTTLCDRHARIDQARTMMSLHVTMRGPKDPVVLRGRFIEDLKTLIEATQ